MTTEKIQHTPEELHAALSKMHLRATGQSTDSYMSIPADPRRDADLILSAAIDELAQLRGEHAELRATADLHASALASERATSERLRGALLDRRVQYAGRCEDHDRPCPGCCPVCGRHGRHNETCPVGLALSAPPSAPAPEDKRDVHAEVIAALMQHGRVCDDDGAFCHLLVKALVLLESTAKHTNVSLANIASAPAPDPRDERIAKQCGSVFEGRTTLFCERDQGHDGPHGNRDHADSTATPAVEPRDEGERVRARIEADRPAADLASAHATIDALMGRLDAARERIAKLEAEVDATLSPGSRLYEAVVSDAIKRGAVLGAAGFERIRVLEEALGRIKDKAGSHTVRAEFGFIAQDDPGFGGIYAVADAAIAPASEGKQAPRYDAVHAQGAAWLDSLAAPASEGAPATRDAQVKHMVDRFLGWKLPEDFSPDGGIRFECVGNPRAIDPFAQGPIGTNLFTAPQAEAMVRHMLEGLPASEGATRAGETGGLGRDHVRTTPNAPPAAPSPSKPTVICGTKHPVVGDLVFCRLPRHHDDDAHNENADGSGGSWPRAKPAPSPVGERGGQAVQIAPGIEMITPAELERRIASAVEAARAERDADWSAMFPALGRPTDPDGVPAAIEVAEEAARAEEREQAIRSVESLRSTPLASADFLFAIDRVVLKLQCGPSTTLVDGARSAPSTPAPTEGK